MFGVNGFVQEAVIKDQKSDGTDGGTNTINTWVTRDLNSLEDDFGFVTLSSNEFTLPPGTYDVWWAAPASGVNNHQSRLYDVTASAIEEYGMSSYTGRGGNLGDDIDTVSIGQKIFTITDDNTYRIEHNTAFQHTDEGYGRAGGFGVGEVYTIVKVRRLK